MNFAYSIASLGVPPNFGAETDPLNLNQIILAEESGYRPALRQRENIPASASIAFLIAQYGNDSRIGDNYATEYP
jgi:hypothetical protein